MADDWCPENDGAYRAEMAALHRDNVDQQLLRARAEIERLRAALMSIERIGIAHSDSFARQIKEAQDIARAALGREVDA